MIPAVTLHWVKFIDTYSLGHWGRADVVTMDVQIPFPDQRPFDDPVT